MLKAVATATAAVRNQRKLMKGEGYSKEEVDYALYLRKDNGDEPVERIQAQARVAKWLAHPVGHQFNLFDETAVDRTPSVEKAYEAGKVAGLEGKSAICPHDASTAHGQEWLRGHGDGQEILSKGFKPLDPATGDEDVRPRFARGMPGAPIGDVETTH